MKTAKALPLTLALLPARGIRSAFPDLPYDNDELEVRADYYTKGGKYRGGFPKFENGYEFHACTDLMNYGPDSSESDSNDYWGDATVCMAWGSNEVGSYESQYGRCSCRSVMDEEYCDAWTCSDLEAYNAPCPRNNATTATNTTTAATETCVVETVVQSFQCACETESVSGLFCSSWVCLESEYSYGQEYGDFRCVRAAPSLEYCEAWTGVTDSRKEVEFSACLCTEASSNATVCLQWECKIRGMVKCSHAGTGWCDMGFSVGIACFFGSLGAALAALGLSRLRKRNPPVSRACAGMDLCLGSFWMVAWSVGVVMWGGEDGAMTAIIWWGSFLAIGLLCGCFNTRPSGRALA